jgi:hypothetical protein
MRSDPVSPRLSRTGKRIPTRESFWMTPKLSYIVIINLIANFTFLYHKPENPR